MSFNQIDPFKNEKLIFNSNAVISSLQASEIMARDYVTNYINQLNQLISELKKNEMSALSEELFSLFEKNGNRLQYEAVYFQRRKYLTMFGISSILWEKKENLCTLEQILLSICEEECWALPAHVNRITQNNWQIHIDLFASETAQTLMQIVNSLEHELSNECIDKVKQEVFRRIFIPFDESIPPYSNWEYCEHNWCAVCNGSIGMAAISAISLWKEESERLERIILRVSQSIKYYLKGIKEDGTCMEGLSYFTYGMTYFTGFACALYEYSNGKQDLWNDEKVKAIAEFQKKCYFEGGLSVCFSDATSHDKFHMGLTTYLAMKYPSAGIPNICNATDLETDKCYRFLSNYQDYIWTVEYIGYIKLQHENGCLNSGSLNISDEHPIQEVLPAAQWSICHGKRGISYAAKGGHNDEPHNHNDVGSFFYLKDQDMFLVDLGAGEYTKSYFSERRYDILCNSSFGHSVPIINGMPQIAGQEYACDQFVTDGQGKTFISFANAYHTGSIKRLERTLDFKAETGELQVCDSFYRSNGTKSITERLITYYLPKISGNQVILTSPFGKVCDIEILEKQEINLRYSSEEHHNHEGQAETVYFIEWDVDCLKEQSNSEFRISVQ